MNNQFGQQNQPNNLFSNNQQPTNTLFGSSGNPVQSSNTLFGSSSNPVQSSNTLFGSSSNPVQSSNTLFGSSSNPVQSSNTLFGSSSNPVQPNTTSIFGSSSNPVQPNASSLFGSSSNPAQPNTTSIFGTNNPIQQNASSLFGANSINNPVQQNASSLFGINNESSANMFNTFQNVKPDESINEQNRSQIDQSTLISSMKDNSLNLYNLTLQEVIDRHTSILETNIKEFEKDAQNIFQRDLQLIKNKNNYISIQKKLEEENLRLDELSQVLDFFDERLNEIEIGDVEPSTKIIDDFEVICDKFYKRIEEFKDEQDEVLDLVNENYEIIENIDRKLDMLEEVRNIK